MDISLKEIDDIRKTSFRPQAVACLINKERVLLVYKEKHALWQFPQGGVNNGEDLNTALKREVAEELGGMVKIKEDSEPTLVYRNKTYISKRGKRDLRTDAGEIMDMVGKDFFFLAIQTETEDIDIAKTEFNDYIWASYSQGMQIAQKIYQSGKRSLTIDTLNALKEKGFIS